MTMTQSDIGDISKVTLDTTSDEISYATSMLTDFKSELSEDDFDDTYNNTHIDDISKLKESNIQNKKKFKHDIHLLKIELSQKALKMDSMKTELLNKIDELTERDNINLHKNALLQSKLSAMMKNDNEQSRNQHTKITHELSDILRRQKDLEETNARLQERSGDIRKSLDAMSAPSADRYNQLTAAAAETRSIKDYVEMKLFECAQPPLQECKILQSNLKSVTSDLNTEKNISNSLKKELEEHRNINADLTKQLNKLSLTLHDSRTQEKIDIFKTQNFDNVKQKSEEFENKYCELKNEYTILNNQHEISCKEFNEVKNELNVVRQSISLLKQDKEFLSSKNHDLSRDLAHALTRAQTGDVSLERAKTAREELYDKYVSSRDEQRTEYEDKLRNEINKIRSQTDIEIERLKSTCHQTFERENRGLREARDQAIAEKQQHKQAENEILKRYDDLLHEFRVLQTKQDGEFGDLQMQLKLKSFESERSGIVHEETGKALTAAQMLSEKLQKKLDVITQEYYGLQMTAEAKLKDVQAELAEKNSQLLNYEKIEQEMDNVIIQAAEVEDESKGDKLLSSYGYGANIPTQSKRRLKQSVDLARRVLSLERANTSLRQDLEQALKNLAESQQRNSCDKKLLEESAQPQQVLVKHVKEIEACLKLEKQTTKSLKEKVVSLKQDRHKLQQYSNKMAVDIKYLLSQSKEISDFKEKIKGRVQKNKGCGCCKKSNSSHNVHMAVGSLPCDNDLSNECKYTSPPLDSYPTPLVFTIPEQKKTLNESNCIAT